MPRVLVVGQECNAGPLPCIEFAEQLSHRLGIAPLPRLRSPDAPELSDWIATDIAGTFTESLFRQAETVVWLHYSPLPYLQDWLAHCADRIGAFLSGNAHATPRARLSDVADSFRHLMRAQHMYALFSHPALAHLRVIELRTPRQAQFWLMTLKRRPPSFPSSPAGSQPSRHTP